ncbi:hypothetical protein QQ020_04345 [Fulvivirgaceae bacterium BMA12]|uniref:CcmD family protein n=1 Tax=Agaribacillus aureus TaxID=3051825 RepID=A0ABT8L2I0_9BACT|nr:hypothetical protein [Fulvivirgaceae bacterium BMA12]
MMIKTKLIFLLPLVLVTNTYAQVDNTVEMADILRQDGKIYTVVFGLLVILTGLILFLIRIDKKIFTLEKNIEDRENVVTADLENQ